MNDKALYQLKILRSKFDCALIWEIHFSFIDLLWKLVIENFFIKCHFHKLKYLLGEYKIMLGWREINRNSKRDGLIFVKTVNTAGSSFVSH